MGPNENMVSGKWREIKGEVQKSWGMLTDDELEKTKGDMKQISGLIQQRYGAAQSGFEDKLSKIFKGASDAKSQALDKAKTTVGNK